MLEEKRCPHCETLFLPNNDRQIYCSQLCKKRAAFGRYYLKYKPDLISKIVDRRKRREGKGQ
jgi:hypothetical protein